MQSTRVSLFGLLIFGLACTSRSAALVRWQEPPTNSVALTVPGGSGNSSSSGNSPSQSSPSVMTSIVLDAILPTYLAKAARAAQDFLRSISDSVAKAKDSTGDMITKHGYPQENHTVHTIDGYRLTIFRLPSVAGKPVAFVMHGIMSSSDDFVVMGPNEALAYALYDAGFDVWLGNARGNTYGRSHVNLSTSSDEFWDFSYHEIGLFDLPAIIDYILLTTGQDNLTYIGHSQGTTSFFALASEKPDYNTKVHAMVALAPIAFLNGMQSVPMKVLAKQANLIEAGLNAFGVDGVELSTLLRGVEAELCSLTNITQTLCSNALFLVAGHDSELLNMTMLDNIFAHIPAGSSVKSLKHYAQNYNSGRFCQFDYNTKNSQRYNGSSTPPSYDLSRISTQVHLFYGHNDLLSVEEDVLRLSKLLPNVGSINLVPYEKFNHVDFVYATRARELVYSDAIGKINASLQNLTLITRKQG